MSILDGVLLRIFKSGSSKEVGQMTIIVQKPYDTLLKELQKTFMNQEDVNIAMDRRYGQRRTTKKLVTNDRRVTDRRKTKQLLVEVVIST